MKNMVMPTILCWFVCAVLAGAEGTGTVRVAAIQCYSQMGQVSANTSNLVRLIRRAAGSGAKIVVTPECAVQGYLDPSDWTSWTAETNAGLFAVAGVAQTVPGPATTLFSALAEELRIYLCIGLIERAGDQFFNAQVLLAPDGKIVAHHRKKALWTPGDSLWCSPGDRPLQVVDTPYGRLGLMICFDFHVLPEQLAKQKVDIVLYSVGWYGPNEDYWFRTRFPQQVVAPFGFNVVSANWAGRTDSDVWPGRGHSCIIAGDGTVLAIADTVTGNEVVSGDVPTNRVVVVRDPVK